MLQTAVSKVAAATKSPITKQQTFQLGPEQPDIALQRKRSSCKELPGVYGARQQALEKHLGTANRIPTVSLTAAMAAAAVLCNGNHSIARFSSKRGL
jgi:hypothetical protein